MHRAFLTYLARRLLLAVLLVVVVSSASLLLVEAAPGDYFGGFDIPPAVAAAERHRLGLDRPFLVRYRDWLGPGRLALSRATALDKLVIAISTTVSPFAGVA